MRPDLERPATVNRPLVGNIEAVDRQRSGLASDDDRDEAILRVLREKLKERNPVNTPVTGGRRVSDKRSSGEEDKYEPQRISRKIVWQYDNTGSKVPLLRRPYI
jgi:hypothetical protein